MPLYKRKPFALLEKPKDLDTKELLFQVRFTKEVFRNYGEYLKRINLYRQRVWTCKVTGRSNLTYEEALVSEKQANVKVEQFPEDLVGPVLREVQFSMLTLRDLLSTISSKLREHLLEGSEVSMRKNNRIYPCKIVKVLVEEADKTQYEVALLDKDKKATGNAVVNEDDLIRKKLPFSRDVLRSFIKKSTIRGVPWVLHDKLARKHGIATDPPEELKGRFSIQNGCVVSNRKRKQVEISQNNVDMTSEGLKEYKKKNVGSDNEPEGDKPKGEPIKYPIEDLLVQPAADDPVFTKRPTPSRDFQVPMDCVGDFLMVWDFCSSFGRLLNLSPFDLKDFENALCHKDCTPVLLVESHSALLRLLLRDEGEYFMAIKKKKRKPKVTLVTWTDYICDFLEMIEIADLSSCITIIRRGHYGLVDIHAKLGILRELVSQGLNTDLVREKLDGCIEERQALAATRRVEAIEEAKKRRAEKERLKVESEEKALPKSEEKAAVNGHIVEPVGISCNKLVNHSHIMQNGDRTEKQSEKAFPSCLKHKLEKSGSNQVETPLKKAKKQGADAKVAAQNVEDTSGNGAQELIKDNEDKAIAKRKIEHRKEYLEQEMEKRFIRTNPLGKDRHHNRYWFFRRDWRIFVESSDSEQWGYYIAKEELDALMGSLNWKGVRERALKTQLEKYYNKLSLEMQKISKEAAHRIAEEAAELRRSSRVRAPPRKNPALAFLKYVNKWKED